VHGAHSAAHEKLHVDFERFLEGGKVREKVQGDRVRPDLMVGSIDGDGFELGLTDVILHFVSSQRYKPGPFRTQAL